MLTWLLEVSTIVVPGRRLLPWDTPLEARVTFLQTPGVLSHRILFGSAI